MNKPTYTEKQMVLIDKHRDCNVDHQSWAAWTTDDFMEVAKAFGIWAGGVSWSGFWSQGDGASFDVSNTSMAEVLNGGMDLLQTDTYGPADDMTGYVAAFRDLYYYVNDKLGFALINAKAMDVLDNTSWWVQMRGNYSHSGTMVLITGDDPESTDFADEMPPGFIELVNETREDLQDLLRACANALYTALEEEHDHLTGNDAVWETIVANGWDHDEDEEDDDE